MKKAPVNFSDRLKNMRENFRDKDHLDRGLTLQELGKMAGMTFGRIADFEAGRRRPGRESLKKLADAFGLDSDQTREFISAGIEDTGMKRLQGEVQIVPNISYKCLMDEVSLAAKGLGVSPVEEVFNHPGCDLMWKTGNSYWFAVEILAVVGDNPDDAIRKLNRKIRDKAENLRKQK